MHAPCLHHHLSHSCLAVLKCPQRFVLRRELFAAAAYPAPREVNFAQRILSLRVLGKIDLLQDLQVRQPALFLRLRMLIAEIFIARSPRLVVAAKVLLRGRLSLFRHLPTII